MDARNYTCDYNFDWVEKLQPNANKVLLKDFHLKMDVFISLDLFRVRRVNLNINQQINMIHHRVH